MCMYDCICAMYDNICMYDICMYYDVGTTYGNMCMCDYICTTCDNIRMYV